MSITVSRARKAIIALVAAASIGAVAAPASAEAKGWKHHHHYGYGAAAIGGGLLLGAIIASNRAYAADCWIEKRKFYDAYGYPYFRKIRVCD
ncbi:hypothetical protein IHQ68_00050 [Chelatococcus sambhunathii]|uniref:Lectin-like protein BA14k n=1 Tax=Chelatococcus sambhunathii TaxID=363953 RepID=A0ABU1DA62_9HYPH|nr:hypothetical protein [Chelatococcus sambhunathii]MDR4305019.1 hypothetical protein [Chelatococcus sambhunathii]